MKHYDEALIFLNAAAHRARPIEARAIMEATSGNLGASPYYHLGDFEKALSNFQQAEAEAKEIGTCEPPGRLADGRLSLQLHAR